MQSLMSSNPTLSFDGNDNISVCAYKMSKTSKHVIATHCKVESSDGDGKAYNGYIQDPEWKATLLLVGSFRRLLQVLNLQWASPELDSAPLGMEPLMTLFALLSKYPLVTNEQIKLFFNDFGFERFYKFNKTQSPARNRDLLCELFACLQPCRIAIYDGQHRELACLHALLIIGSHRSPSQGILTQFESLLVRQLKTSRSISKCRTQKKRIFSVTSCFP